MSENTWCHILLPSWYLLRECDHLLGLQSFCYGLPPSAAALGPRNLLEAHMARKPGNFNERRGQPDTTADDTEAGMTPHMAFRWRQGAGVN